MRSGTELSQFLRIFPTYSCNFLRQVCAASFITIRNRWCTRDDLCMLLLHQFLFFLYNYHWLSTSSVICFPLLHPLTECEKTLRCDTFCLRTQSIVDTFFLLPNSNVSPYAPIVCRDGRTDKHKPKAIPPQLFRS